MRVSKTLFILSAPENHPWDKWLQITSSPPWSCLCFFKMFWILNWYFFPWYPRKNIYSDNLINNYERQQSFFNINNWKRRRSTRKYKMLLMVSISGKRNLSGYVLTSSVLFRDSLKPMNIQYQKSVFLTGDSHKKVN